MHVLDELQYASKSKQRQLRNKIMVTSARADRARPDSLGWDGWDGWMGDWTPLVVALPQKHTSSL